MLPAETSHVTIVKELLVHVLKDRSVAVVDGRSRRRRLKDEWG